jgi:hypothetical protein
MKRAPKARSDPRKVAGPVTTGTALFALLDWLAGRVARQLSDDGPRNAVRDGPHVDAPNDRGCMRETSTVEPIRE